MAIFLQRASQQYAQRAQPYQISGNIPAGKVVDSIRVTLSREGWPDGPIADVTLTYPDGNDGTFSLSGGNGTPQSGGGFAPNSVVQWHNNGAPMPTGAYQLSFLVKQTATTAVTVEYFP